MTTFQWAVLVLGTYGGLLAVMAIALLRMRRQLRQLAISAYAARLRSSSAGLPCKAAELVPTERQSQADTKAAEEEPLPFEVDALLLAQLYQYLRDPRVETFAYVAGHKIGEGRYVLSHLLPVVHAERSACGARADVQSSIEVLGGLTDCGMQLTGHAHTHPGSGAGGIWPSGVDRSFVRSLADGGYTALGLIFSQDRYVRAFMHEGQSFTVKVVGNNVREVGEYVWQIETELADSSLPVSVPAVPGRGERAARRAHGL